MHTPRPKILRRAGLLFALTFVLLHGPTPAHAADEPLAGGAALMQTDMHRYFAGEKNGGIWLMGVGGAATAVGTGLFFPEGDFYRGMAYPVLILGVLELLGGAAFYVNTNRRVPRFDQQLRQSPAEFRDGELRRIRRVNRELSFLTAVELTLIVAGGTMAGVGAMRDLQTLSGVGTGLLLHATVLFIYDQLAARRALRYTDSLARFNVGLVSGPASTARPDLTPRGALLTMQGQF